MCRYKEGVRVGEAHGEVEGVHMEKEKEARITANQQDKMGVLLKDLKQD